MHFRLSFLYIIVLVSLCSLSSCIQYKEVEVVKVTDVGVKEISTKGIDIEVAMQIKNPNKYNISIVDSDLILFVKEKKMGAANIKEKITLPKKSNKIHRFTIQTTLKDLASGTIPVLMGLITQSNIDLQIQGDIKAKAKGLSKTFPIDFKERVRL